MDPDWGGGSGLDYMTGLFVLPRACSQGIVGAVHSSLSCKAPVLPGLPLPLRKSHLQVPGPSVQDRNLGSFKSGW